MPSEDVIELSIAETNKLREKLGLKPLRIDNKNPVAVAETGVDSVGAGAKDNNEEEALELSVEDTNKLREKLGLAPLRTSSEDKNKEIHKPAENTGEQEQAVQRIEQAKLRRQVEDGAAKTFGTSTLGLDDETEVNNKNDDDVDDGDWADRMRQQTEAPAQNGKKKGEQSVNVSDKKRGNYDEADLEGLQVRNSMAGLEAGEGAVLTLADASILETKTFVSNKVVGINEEEDALENIGLTEQEKQRDGLRKKRMLEMGMGRAGGYAGFDDDEFEELGGTLGPSHQHRGDSSGKEKGHKSQGFRIGSKKADPEDASKTDFDRVQAGEAISLVWTGNTVSSDYMTIEEEEELKAKRKKSKEKTRFKKKKKSKKKKRRAGIDDDDDDEGERNTKVAPTLVLGTKSDNILSKLEETAGLNKSSSLQKRRRIDDVADEEGMQLFSNGDDSLDTKDNKLQQTQTKRSNYEKIMEKGNERTRKAFDTVKIEQGRETMDTMDDEPDDSFLNAALAKARRLNRLREMNKVASIGANIVAEAVKSSSVETSISKESSGISFSIDDTREFSRAIRARTQQKERDSQKQKEETPSDASVLANTDTGTSAVETSDNPADKPCKKEDTEIDEEVEDVDMEELAKEVKEDNLQSEFDGSTARSVGVGRGLSSFVSMLRTTGEITGRHGGKEELRGRAKDERNYDNYEPLDLSKVVAIGRNATEKDEELAQREIKLEYRDKFGRLLTQKEAYRDLCYQFHGHGGGKKKEEKRLKQITREQAEARMASGQVSAARDGTAVGTLGALRATQKATGKAFVVHKT